MATNIKIKKSDDPAIKRFGNSIIKFFTDLKAEFKRITWPSKEDAKKATIAVFVFVIIYLAYVFVFDSGFGKLYDYIFKIK